MYVDFINKFHQTNLRLQFINTYHTSINIGLRFVRFTHYRSSNRTHLNDQEEEDSRSKISGSLAGYDYLREEIESILNSSTFRERKSARRFLQPSPLTNNPTFELFVFSISKKSFKRIEHETSTDY